MRFIPIKYFIITGVTLFTPILLIFLLAVALYIPPIQNWAVHKACEYAQESTGMEVKIEKVRLSFPLNLSIEGVSVDTLMQINRAVVDVEAIPLFSGDVKVNAMELLGAKLNTADYIPQARIKGTIDRLAIEDDSPVADIDLNNFGVKIASVALEQAHLDIKLTDSVPEDTTESENKWKIYVQSLNISQSDVMVHMPGDTLQVGVGIGNLKAKEGAFDLLKGEYKLTTCQMQDSWVSYDNNYSLYTQSGLDVNHIKLNDLRLRIDSLNYLDPELNLIVKECSFVEKSGITLNSLTANIALDSTQVRLDANASTPVSSLYANVQMDLNALDDNNPGKVRAIFDASIGRQDLMMAFTDMPQAFKNAFPTAPLSIKGNVVGNMKQVYINGLDIDLPSAFSLQATGNARGFMSLSDNIFSNNFIANLHADLKTYNLSFVKSLLDRSTAKTINIPSMHAIADIDIHGAEYNVNLRAAESKGTLTAKAKFNTAQMSYNADVKANNLQIGHFVKGMQLGAFSGTVKASGQGFDYTKKSMKLNAEAKINNFIYGKYNLNNITALANISNGNATVDINADNKLMNGNVSLAALLSSKIIKTTVTSDLNNVDLYNLFLVDAPLQFSLCGHFDIETDLDQYYKVNALVNDISITDTVQTFRPDGIEADIFTRRDTTAAHIDCGDFEIKLNAQGGYKWLMGCSDRLITVLQKQYEARTIDQAELRTQFPRMQLYMDCGKNNPIYNFIKYSGFDYNEVYANINTSREDGINGNMHIYGLNTDGYQIDTIRVEIDSSNDPMDISYKAHIQNVKPNDYVFNLYLDGNLLEHGVKANGRFYDENGELGMKLGTEATMEEDGIVLHLIPETPVIAYETFSLNSDNYIRLDKNNRIYANVDLKSPSGVGMQIYSTDEDNDAMQDLTFSINKLNLSRLLSSIPYAPKAEGMLNGDFHFIQSTDKTFSISSDMNVQNMVYEGCSLGNIGTQLVYMPKEDGSHYVDGHIMLDDKEVGAVEGSYNFNTDAVDAKLKFMKFPMELANGFVPDQIIGLEGYAEGELTVQGTTVKPMVNGELFLESASLLSVPYGVKMKFDDEPITITNSRLLFENFQMYDTNDVPLVASGFLDFNDTEHIKLNLRMKAENFKIIDAKESKNSEAYGKAYVNFFCMITGELDKLQVRGKLDVLPTTNLYYILRDSPLTTDNRLKELVTFVDFSEENQPQIVRPTIDGINVDLSITVKDGAHVKCWLSTDHSNYLDLIGGGDLRMKYSNDDINLTGRYTISEGEMKYSLPVIPLKTFTIASDSYIEFTGDMMNPKLNITATENTKATCNVNGVDRIVEFNCGVVITKTLNDMGLQFVIEAPEEQTISEQLNMMSLEERGKVAVTMLTTGMYLSDGNTSSFSMNSALNSFLQSEINNIAGNALKTLDLSFGMDNSTEEDGTMHTNYTFKFAKRFWNNRLSISVGGKISTGPDVSGQNQSFFDNVEATYRLSDTSNQYMNLFYKRSVYDYLEGYVGQYGAGYMYKRKLQHITDLFKNSSTTVATPPQGEKKDTLVRFK